MKNNKTKKSGIERKEWRKRKHFGHLFLIIWINYSNHRRIRPSFLFIWWNIVHLDISHKSSSNTRKIRVGFVCNDYSCNSSLLWNWNQFRVSVNFFQFYCCWWCCLFFIRFHLLFIVMCNVYRNSTQTRGNLWSCYDDVDVDEKLANQAEHLIFCLFIFIFDLNIKPHIICGSSIKTLIHTMVSSASTDLSFIFLMKMIKYFINSLYDWLIIMNALR